jgi:chromosome segregation ATPase
MEQSQKKVLGDFEKFSESSLKNQEEFEKSIAGKYEKLRGDLDSVQTSLDEIKRDSAARLSAKVKVFEDSFEGDLKKRQDDLEARLSDWKSRSDNQFANFTNEYEVRRQTIENQYNEALTKRIAELSRKTQEQEKKFQTTLLAGQSTIQEQINTVNQTIHEFMATYKNDINKSIEEANGYLKDETDDYSRRMNEQMQEIESDLNSQFDEFKAMLSSSQESQRASIDASIQEVNGWKKRIATQFEDVSGKLDDQVKKLEEDINSRFTDFRDNLNSEQDEQKLNMENSTQEVEEWKNRISLQFENAAGKIDEQLKKISKDNEQKIQSMQKDFSDATKQADEVLAHFDKKTKEAISEFGAQFDALKNDADSFVEEREKFAGQKSKELKDEYETQIVKYSKTYNDAFEKLTGDTQQLQIQIDEIRKGIADFKVETNVFDQANILKKQLEKSMEDLRKKISTVKQFEEKLNDLKDQWHRLEEFGENVNSRLNKYGSDKTRLDDIEFKFNTLMNLSSGMDAKISELTGMSDEITNMQARVSKFGETVSTLQDKVARIDNKKETYDRIAEEVDSSFKNISNLEKRLEDCVKRVNKIPDEIQSVQNDIDKISRNSGKINDAVDKITSLHKLVEETEEKIRLINESKSNFSGTEVRLQELNKNVDEKLGLLKTISVERERKNKNVAASSSITPKLKADVIRLKKMGWSNSQISSSLNIEEYLVDAILNFESGEE